MMRRVGRLVAGETIKLGAQPFLYIALGILAFVTLVAALLLPLMSGQKPSVWREPHAAMLFSYGFGFGLKTAMFVLVILSSMTFAGEFDRGTIKNLLTRPLTRLEFFVAKCLTVAGLGVLLYGFVFAVAALYALTFGSVGPVWDDTVYTIQRTEPEIARHFRKAILFSVLSFLAAGFLGILVSNFTESSGYAVATGLVIFVAADLVTGLLKDHAKQKVFFYYASYAIDRLTKLSEGTNASWNQDIDAHLLWLQVPLYSIVLFVPAAYAIFRSRNITA
jgi:ABC-type transport system involved in multi-copper enzyme maturation permease subunit